MLFGGKALQHWRQFESQATGLPILGVLDKSEETSEDKEGKERGTESGKVPAGIMLEMYKSSMRKFMRYYFVNHQYAARTQKHYLRNYLQKPKELGIWHVVARLQEIKSMLPYFLPPSNSKFLEDKLVKIILCLIPAGWKHMMMCANFKPLEASMEELVEYLEEVERSEIKNPPDRNPRKNNSNGPKQTKKNNRKCEEDRESHDVTANTMSSKKSRRNCKLCKMFGGNAESHSTERCNKKPYWLVFLMDIRGNVRTSQRKRNFAQWRKPSRRPTSRTRNLARGLLPTHQNWNLPWMRSDIHLN
eukprot:9442699-Ditylum_brightwellii.AAC.1